MKGRQAQLPRMRARALQCPPPLIPSSRVTSARRTRGATKACNVTLSATVTVPPPGLPRRSCVHAAWGWAPRMPSTSRCPIQCQQLHATRASKTRETPSSPCAHPCTSCQTAEPPTAHARARAPFPPCTPAAPPKIWPFMQFQAADSFKRVMPPRQPPGGSAGLPAPPGQGRGQGGVVAGQGGVARG